MKIDNNCFYKVVENYDRTWEQNEEFGLNDLNTENYENKQ